MANTKTQASKYLIFLTYKLRNEESIPFISISLEFKIIVKSILLPIFESLIFHWLCFPWLFFLTHGIIRFKRGNVYNVFQCISFSRFFFCVWTYEYMRCICVVFMSWEYLQMHFLHGLCSFISWFSFRLPVIFWAIEFMIYID